MSNNGEYAIDVAVVVTTYNRPAALSWVLASLSRQTVMPGQIVVADDGSGIQTRVVIEAWQLYFNTQHPKTKLIHAWQEDRGFRAAAARNLAVQCARNAQQSPRAVIFLDGDCVVPSYFVENHLELLDKGLMVAGGRGLLTQVFTRAAEEMVDNLSPGDLVKMLRVFTPPFRLWLTGACDRFLSMYPCKNQMLNFFRDARPTDDSVVRTCNLSVWLDDFDRVGGFNESFVGWGLEDTELAVRLISAGVRVRSGRFATNTLHLWHAERCRSEFQANSDLLGVSRSRARNTARG